MIVVRGNGAVVVSDEDRGLEEVLEGDREDGEFVVGGDPGEELTADSNTAMAAQKLLRLSLSSAADEPSTVTMLTDALVLRARNWTLLDDSMETMLSWQLAVARQSWL